MSGIPYLGYPGGSVLNIYDALYEFEADDIHILLHHMNKVKLRMPPMLC